MFVFAVSLLEETMVGRETEKAAKIPLMVSGLLFRGGGEINE